MRALEASDVLRIWEQGRDRHPVDRALVLLLEVSPEEGFERLAGLGIGERNARLLELYERCFGPSLEGIGRCSGCGAELEFSADARALRALHPTAAEDTSCVAGDILLRFRPPDSRDVAAIAGCADPASARARLAERCLLEARRAGECVSFASLPASALDALGVRIAECDPLCHLEVELDCPNCSHCSTLALDVVDFVWSAVAAEARRFLDDVDALARAYGWSEREILGLGEQRRRAYVEMVT